MAGSWQRYFVMPKPHCCNIMSSHHTISMRGPRKPIFQQQLLRRLRQALTSYIAARTSASERPVARSASPGMSASPSRLLEPRQTHGFIVTMSTGGH
eukprot:gene12180-biopygen114584